MQYMTLKKNVIAMDQLKVLTSVNCKKSGTNYANFPKSL